MGRNIHNNKMSSITTPDPGILPLLIGTYTLRRFRNKRTTLGMIWRHSTSNPCLVFLVPSFHRFFQGGLASSRSDYQRNSVGFGHILQSASIRSHSCGRVRARSSPDGGRVLDCNPSRSVMLLHRSSHIPLVSHVICKKRTGKSKLLLRLLLVFGFGFVFAQGLDFVRFHETHKVTY